MSNGDKGFSISWSVFIQVIGWVVAALLTFSAFNSRMSVMENELKNLKELVMRKP